MRSFLAVVVATFVITETVAIIPLVTEVLTRNCEGRYVCDCAPNCPHPVQRTCLHRKFTCDGIIDCPLGDDEGVELCDRGAFNARRTREIFMKVEKIDWDYLSTGENLVDNEYDYINNNMVNAANRVGSVFSKYVYKRYTDDTYTTEIPKPVHQGYVGPLIHAEVGDRLVVHLWNTATVPVSAHPHGFHYTKMNEGALYSDGTTGDDKRDDGVPPGQTMPLIWELTGDFAPTEDDANCIPFVYHSHVSTLKEVNAGLSGLLTVCKPGILNGEIRTDVDKEFLIYVDSTNEGHSWLTDENLQRCGTPAACIALLAAGDPDMEESLKKDAINGYMFGHVPGIDICIGEKVAWYIFSVEAELHPVHIHGHTVIHNHHRSAVLGIWSATFLEAETVSTKAGRWMISCLNSEHNTNGMRAYMTVNSCPGLSYSETLNGVYRDYYIRAENEDWNYAPSGQNQYDGGSLLAAGSDSEVFFETSATRIGGVYRKSRFVEYTDASFATVKPRSADEQHMALLGPAIRAVVGDTIRITLDNQTPFPVSIYLQGVAMDKSEDGTWEKIPTAPYTTMEGKVVSSGSQVVYQFEVPASVAPLDDDPPCLSYMYYSAYDYDRDLNAGLVGPLLICKQKALDETTGRQVDIDHEMFLYYSVVDEGLSWHIDHNIATYAPSAVPADGGFQDSNLMHSINGRMYGNLEGLDMCKGDRVVWHVMSFGQGQGLHGVTWAGNPLLIGGINRVSHVTISGLTFTAAMMNADNVGVWSISCHNSHHFDSGMKALYTVDPCGDTSVPFVPSNGVTRTYYIAAVERAWDYAPSTIHPVTGEDYSDPASTQYGRVRSDDPFVGSVYTKALYRQFDDASFTVEISPEAHLGMMGPFMRVEEGDTLQVVFKNMASRPYSIHAMGLLYDKDNEGMPYEDGASATIGDGVPPTSTYTYTWTVPRSFAPVDNGPNCIGSMYHSAVNPTKDTYSGLVGPLVICKRGTLGANDERTDSVDKEFALLFFAVNENLSWYFDVNVNLTALAITGWSAEFEESNMYDCINGYVHANQPGLVMNRNDNVEWYVLGLGGDEDIHTAHFHGQMFIYRSGTAHIGDVIEVFPGISESVLMYAHNRGTWLIHCHVGQHLVDGMVTTYRVV